MDPVNVPAKFELRSFTRSWDNSDWSFGWGLWTPNLREEEAVGKSVGEFLYPTPHSSFSSIFRRFRDIAAFVSSSITPLPPHL